MFLLWLLLSCGKDKEEEPEIDSPPEITIEDPVHIDTSPAIIEDTMPEPDLVLENCTIQHGFQRSTNTTIYDYDLYIEGCISPDSIDVIAVFYGHDYAGDIICGEAIQMESISSVPSYPCASCDFTHDVSYVNIFTDTPRCEDYIIGNNWWLALGYNDALDTLFLRSSLYWENTWVHETQQIFADNMIHFVYP